MKSRLPAHEALRNGTAADHERLDALFAQFDLADATSYGRFLSAHAAALLPADAALDKFGMAELLPDWMGRRRGHLIRADLAALNLPTPELLQKPAIDSAAESWGLIYVIEGSRLGGALLARSVGPGLPSAYLSAPQPPGGWRKLLERLDAALISDDDYARATGAARAVFALFEEAGRRYGG